MTHSTSTEPTSIHTITPFICAPEGAKLIEFMQHTFGAEETSRHPHGPDGFVAGVVPRRHADRLRIAAGWQQGDLRHER